MKLFDRLAWLLCLFVLIFASFMPVTHAQAVASRLPLLFELNRGQAPAEDRYLLRGTALSGEFQNDGVTLSLKRSNDVSSKVTMRLVGAHSDAAIAGSAPQGNTNYLVGADPARWLHNVPNFTEVRYRQVFDGTDLVFYGNDGSLEHDFEVSPGADPHRIAFRMEGAGSVALDKNGDLQIGLHGGNITFGHPVAYQTFAGTRRPVDAAFTVDHDRTVRFRIGHYDATETLVIDPVLSFATYLPPLPLAASLIATDVSGNSYVAGVAPLAFPVTPGAFAGCAHCTTDYVVTFISKLSPDGTKLIYSTTIGGNSFAQPTGLAVDGTGNALVSGWTGASDFPTKNGQPIAPPNNAYSGFLVSLTPDGSALNFGTMLGSAPSASIAAMTYASAVAIDSSGNAYVTGQTGDGFAVTAGALNQGGGGNFDNQFNVYLAKFSFTGSLLYSAVLGLADPQNGGDGPTGASALAIDSAGNAYVAGQAGTLWPISSNAYLKQIAGPQPYATPFVTKVAPDAKSLVYSTFLDYAYVVSGIAVLPNGNLFVAGDGADSSYPTTSNAYHHNTGNYSAFLTELNADGSSLVYSTVIGDSTYSVNGMALDAEGDIWLAAQTADRLFPLVTPIQGVFPSSNSYLAPASLLNEFDPTGETLKFSTFLGGNTISYASGVAVDPSGKVHVSGAAEYGMYTTPGAFNDSVPTPAPGPGEELFAYVALIDPAKSSATVCLGNWSAGLTLGAIAPQTTQSVNVTVSNCGSAPLSIVSVTASGTAFSAPAATNHCTAPIAVGSSCTVDVVFAPTAVQTYSGQLTFTSNATIATTSIPLFGTGGAPVASFNSPPSFQPLLVGQTSPPTFIELFNNGNIPLTIYLSQITVTKGFVLGSGGNCPSSLPAHQSCLISILFKPLSAGTYTGTLSVASNDPVHPTLSCSPTGTAYAAYPVPTITSLRNPSYPINSGTTPITLQVNGTNFFPASVVYISGVAQTTSYQSSTYLNATFSPSLVNAFGAFPVTVVNPTPGGGTSSPYPLLAYLSVPLTASALIVDRVGGLLYAAVPASAAQHPNTVIPINPATGITMTPIPVATDPQLLAVSDDGTELYVASTGVLQRFNLKTLILEKTFNMPVDSEFGQTYIHEMHVVPGSPQSIVVSLFANVDPAEDGAALYNDSGLVNWIPGVGSFKNRLMLDSFTFTSPTTIYGLPEGNAFFADLQVSNTGLSVVSPGGFSCCNENTGSELVSDGSLLYTNSGEVWDPSKQKLLGTYLQANGSQIFYAPSVVPDTSNGHTYILNDSLYSDYDAVAIEVYDQASYALLGAVPFTNINYLNEGNLVRWGPNGFAFLSVDITGSNPTANQIVILTSSLIASNTGAPIPILTSVSPATVQAGGPGYTMQLSGSGFTAASVVLINGSTRSTTYANGTSLTAAVLASDIATNGQLNVQVTTPAPGGGTSNYKTVSVQQPPLMTPIVTVTPSATTTTTAQALRVVVSVSGATGSAVPTGFITLSGSGYTSASTTLSSGAASIIIPAAALSSGTDTLTATYSGDVIYAGSSGTASLTVDAVLISAPAPPGVAPGANATTTVTLATGSTYSGTFNFSCKLVTSPAGAQSTPTCSLSPTSVNITNGSAASTVLTVKTTAATTAALLAHPRMQLFGLGGGGTILAGLMLIRIPVRRRRWMAMMVLLCTIIGTLAAGCGGGNTSTSGASGSSAPATTAGNYVFSVTGTDAAIPGITASATVAVNVQ